MARRWIDAAIVVLVSPVLVPLAAVSLAAVWLGDRHRPLISFTRVGHLGRPLRVTKIRSMRPARPEDALITGSADDRITRVGRRLRRFRLDELPQVLSVLRGEMALIGPRPEDPAFVDLEDFEWQAALTARPGIAGLCQVIAGAWEETQLTGDDPARRYRDVAVPAKVAIDAFYARNAGPVLDWLVIRSLVLQFLAGRDATPAHELVADRVPGAAPLLAFDDELDELSTTTRVVGAQTIEQTQDRMNTP